MISTKGYAATAAKADLTPFSFDRRSPKDKDVLIEIQYCGICHSDIHQARDEWGGSLFPMVPGHEIVGIVKEVGNQVSRFKKGDKVGVGCMVDSCQQCDNCQANLEQYCTNGMIPTYNGKEKDGSPTYGGYSNKIVVQEDFVLRLPDNLSLQGAAPLLCAGITLFSPLRHWEAGPGKKVAIMGLGGLGHIGVKIAHALGADVTVLSHSPHKEADSKRLGANHFYSTAKPDTFKKLAQHFDLIICTVSAGLNWNQYLSLLKTNGTMVLIGIPEGDQPVGAFNLIMQRRNLAGSLIGGIQETQEMLDFCGKHGIESDIELIPIDKVNEAYERVLKSDVRYRFVIDIANSLA